MHFSQLRPLLIATSTALFALIASPLLAAEAAAEPVAEIQVPPAPTFDISEFKIEGNELISTDELKSLVQPYTGKGKDFGAVQQALEALQDVYQERGYNAVRVTLPEQELEIGVVLFRVFEQKVSLIKVEGNQFYGAENALLPVPSLKEGENPNINKIGSALKVANENPSKQTTVLFTDSETVENTVEATVKIKDEKPWKVYATLDNTGSRESGHGRISLGYQHFNLFDRDHRATAQFITNTHYPDEYFNSERQVKVFAFAYTIPVYSLGDSVDFVAAYSDTTSSSPTSITPGLLGSISGKGLILGARYNHNLPKVKDFDHKLSLTFDNRDTRAVSTALLGPISPAVSTTPLGLTYSGIWAPGEQQLSFSASAAMNLASFDKHGDKTDFAPFAAESNFKKYNLSVDYLRQLPMDWQFHAAASAQFTSDHLVALEQYRAGGADTVRGFHESAVSGDKGYRWSIEAITPDIGKKIGDNFSLRGLVFTEHAHVSSNTDTTGVNNASRFGIGSVGGGLRLGYGKYFAGKLDIGYVLDGDTGVGGGSRVDGDTFGHISLGVTW